MARWIAITTDRLAMECYNEINKFQVVLINFHKLICNYKYNYRCVTTEPSQWPLLTLAQIIIQIQHKN